MGINAIPQELCLLIAEGLPIKDLYSLLRTCRGLSQLLTPRLHRLGLQDAGELTALQWAAEHGHESLVELAISNGADVNQISKCRLGINALHMAVKSEKPNRNIIRTLIKHGVGVDAVDRLGATPLFWAVSYRRALAVEELLSLGARAGPSAWLGSLAHLAASNGDADCLRALGAAVIDYSGRPFCHTILHEALSSVVGLGAAEYILGQEGGRMMVNIKGFDECTALHLLMENDHLESPSGIEMVKLLLRCGADIRAKDCRADTPAHISARRNDINSMAEFIRAGYDISTQGANGDTVLHVAASSMGVMMKYLLELEGGRSILNARNNEGRTPLHIAVRYGSRRNVKMLLRHGADAGVKDHDGETPLRIAVFQRQFSLVRAFKDAGVDVNFEDMPGRLGEMIDSDGSDRILVLEKCIATMRSRAPGIVGLTER